MRVVLIGLVVVLAGCGDEPAKPRRTPAERAEAAELKLQRTPIPRVYRYGDGELRVLEVPVKDTTGGFVDMQRCFLWRDEAFKTATLSCGQMPDAVLAN